MIEVESRHAHYDQIRMLCSEDYDEIDKLTTWYEYFLQAYLALEEEIERRRVYEEDVHTKVEAFQNYLQRRLEEEQKARVTFNDNY